MNTEDLSRIFDKLSDCAVTVLEAWERRRKFPSTKSALKIEASLSEEDFDAAITELCVLGIIKFDGGVGDTWYRLLEVDVFDLLKTTPKIKHRFTTKVSGDDYSIRVHGDKQGDGEADIDIDIAINDHLVGFRVGKYSLTLNRREWYHLRNEIEQLL